jgi:hypothetical protein
MKIAEVLAAIREVKSGNLTLDQLEDRFTKKRQGRTPDFAYENLQNRINEVAPKIKPNHWKAHSFANQVYASFLLEGNDKVQKPPQIMNLINKGILKLPPAPVVEEKVEA